MVVPTHVVDCVERGDVRGLAEWLENGGDANDRTAEHDSLLCVLASSRDASPAVATLLSLSTLALARRLQSGGFRIVPEN